MYRLTTKDGDVWEFDDLEELKKELSNRGINVEVVKITKYKKAPLDSSCKIIKKIKGMEFDEKIFKNLKIVI